MFAASVPNTAPDTGIALPPLDEFVTTVDEVERPSGLDFFAALEDAAERKLESALRTFQARARK